MSFALGVWIGLGLGAFSVFITVFHALRADFRRRYCNHKLIKQGDLVFWPFDTLHSRYTITWCTRCGAMRLDCGNISNGGWQRINSYRAKEELMS